MKLLSRVVVPLPREENSGTSDSRDRRHKRWESGRAMGGGGYKAREEGRGDIVVPENGIHLAKQKYRLCLKRGEQR